MNPGTAEYWTHALNDDCNSGHALWRAYSDAANWMWFGPRLGDSPCQRVLKTDLFDEVWGPGLASVLATRCRTLIGLDISGTVLEQAGTRAKRIQGDVRVLPVHDCSIDLIVSNSTLDHFDSADGIDTALAEFHRVLCPGGRLLLTLDNLANPAVRLRNALPFGLLKRAGLVPFHVGISLTPAKLERAVKRAGFDIRESTTMMHFPRALGVIGAACFGPWIGTDTRETLVRWALRFERLMTWPTRAITGHFIAIEACKR